MIPAHWPTHLVHVRDFRLRYRQAARAQAESDMGGPALAVGTVQRVSRDGVTYRYILFARPDRLRLDLCRKTGGWSVWRGRQLVGRGPAETCARARQRVIEIEQGEAQAMGRAAE